MPTPASVFQSALSKTLTEIFDGPPTSEAYLLNPGDIGLLRQLESISAADASRRPMPGKTTIASHVDQMPTSLRSSASCVLSSRACLSVLSIWSPRTASTL